MVRRGTAGEEKEELARFGKFRREPDGAPRAQRRPLFALAVICQSRTIRRDSSAYINNISLCERAHKRVAARGDERREDEGLVRVRCTCLCNELRKCIPYTILDRYVWVNMRLERITRLGRKSGKRDSAFVTRAISISNTSKVRT